MNNSKKEAVLNPITEGNIIKALLSFFFPILLGTFFQQLYNTVDAIIVGRFVGTQALAAVGGSAAVYVNLIVGFFMGLTNGGGVIISQLYGAKNNAALKNAVHTSILMSIIGGLIMMIIGISLARPMMLLTRCPESTLKDSVLYLSVFFCGLIPMFVYNMSSAIFRAVGDSKTPLLILITSCLSNIVLDLVFVIFLGLGVLGVALATVFCQTFSAIISLVALKNKKAPVNFNFRNLAIDSFILSRILKIGVPAGFQGSLYVISNLIIQAYINFFGTDTVAGWSAYGKIDGVFWMTVSAFGIALTTFSGQNYGAKQYNRIKKSMWITLGLCSAATVVISLLFWFFSRWIYLLFTADENVITIGIDMLRFLVPFYGLYISIEVLSGTVRGAGKSLVPTLITVFGVCGLRILWLFSAVPANRTIHMVLLSYPITWTITTIAFWIYYFKVSAQWRTNLKSDIQ